MFRRLLLAGALASLVCGPGLVARAASAQGVWLNVPFVKQTEDGCGSASLAMVMQYWLGQQGRAPTPAADAAVIQRALLSPTAHGIYASAMARYLKQNGFQAFTVTGDMDTLRHHLEKGRPLIVALQPVAAAPLHYVVVVGTEPERKLVLVNDPAQRKLLKQDAAVFMEQWKAASNWMLLAVPVESSH